MSSAANASSRFAQLGFGLSVALHVGAFVMLTLAPKMPAPSPLASVVEFELSKPPEPPPKPKTEPPPPTPDPLPLEPAALRAETPTSEATPPPDATEPEPTPEQAPVADLTGLTLTNDNGTGSWGSRVGNGSASDRPIRAGSNGHRPPAPQAQAPATAPARASNVVPLADLSSRPVPPKLDGVLERHYPEVARQQGKSGTAIVRLRIDADGRVRTANVVSESDSGFGRACHATVMGSKWSAPKDHAGNAVATFVSYTCRFRSNQ